MQQQQHYFPCVCSTGFCAYFCCTKNAAICLLTSIGSDSISHCTQHQTNVQITVLCVVDIAFTFLAISYATSYPLKRLGRLPVVVHSGDHSYHLSRRGTCFSRAKVNTPGRTSSGALLTRSLGCTCGAGCSVGGRTTGWRRRWLARSWGRSRA